MAKVLWLGDAGCHTGFARVTHEIGGRLVDDFNHDVHVLAFNHRGDYWPTSLKLYRPNIGIDADIFGMSRIVEMLAKVEPDVVVILHDQPVVLSFLFENQWDKDHYLLKYRPIITYIPIDGHNHPTKWIEPIEKYTDVVAMSKFGQQYYKGSHLVYHGVNTNDFYPVSEQRPITLSNGTVVKSKKECKKAFGYDPDGFLVLRVDKNSGRKDFPATWKALVPVMKKHPDIQVHFHTEAADKQSGIVMENLFSREPALRSRFFLPGMHTSFVGWPEQDLNALYNAADLYVSTSRGEGFGLTLAEAAACGVPIVAQNVSAIPEVVGPGAVLIDPEREITVPSGQDLWLANVEKFTEAIEHLYNAGGVRRKLGEAGREHVTKLTWEHAASKFDELIRKNVEDAKVISGGWKMKSTTAV